MKTTRRNFAGMIMALAGLVTAPRIVLGFFQKKLEPIDDSFSQSTDAVVWAKAFVEHVRRNPAIATDEGTIIGWFANAIMRGWDEGRSRLAVERRQIGVYEASGPNSGYVALKYIDKITGETKRFSTRFTCDFEEKQRLLQDLDGAVLEIVSIGVPLGLKVKGERL